MSEKTKRKPAIVSAKSLAVVPTSIRLTPAVYERLHKIATANHESLAFTARRAIEEWLAKNK